MSYLKPKVLEPNVRIRVLVVDDSVVIRRLVTHALSESPEIEVIGSAANGAIALKMIAALKPDVVTLDIEMPEMDGITTLKELRKLYPRLVVIMFSTLSERGAAITIEALSLGANDYVTKAANCGSLDVSMTRLRLELLPKITQFFIRPQTAGSSKPAAVAAPQAKRPAAQTRSGCRVVGIGVSTGGPTALAELVPAIPSNFKIPIMIVQHMPPVFTKLLADRLQTLTKLRVHEAANDMRIEQGHIYIAPGDYHMRAKRSGASEIIVLDQAEPENSCRPAVDVLFRSLAKTYGGSSVTAVVLTGMGQDGKRGVEQLRNEGSFVIAQDEPSSVVWGMPGAVAQAGLADAVLDLKAIVPELLKHV